MSDIYDMLIEHVALNECKPTELVEYLNSEGYTVIEANRAMWKALERDLIHMDIYRNLRVTYEEVPMISDYVHPDVTYKREPIPESYLKALKMLDSWVCAKPISRSVVKCSNGKTILTQTISATKEQVVAEFENHILIGSKVPETIVKNILFEIERRAE